MEKPDSDVAPLEHQPRLRVPRPWRRWAENAFVIGSIFSGGFGIGAVYTSRLNDSEVARVRRDSLDEIARLQQAYGVRLESAASTVTSAATTAANAAEQASDAAISVTSAANTAKSAAEAVKKPGGKP